jgi:hypothetical protein
VRGRGDDYVQYLNEVLLCSVLSLSLSRSLADLRLLFSQPVVVVAHRREGREEESGFIEKKTGRQSQEIYRTLLGGEATVG